MNLGFGQSSFSNFRAEELRGMQFDPAAQKPAELAFHREELQTRRVAWFELDQNIHVALRAEISTHHRTKQRELMDVVSAAEFSNLFPRYADRRT